MRFMMEACEFWKKIKQNLSELGKTQEWLCSKTGMDLQSLRNRIHKNRFPTVQETLKILSVFEISAEDFFGMNLPKNEPFVSKNVMLIPVIDQVFSAGKGQYVPEDESVVEYVSVPNELKRYGKNLKQEHFIQEKYEIWRQQKSGEILWNRLYMMVIRLFAITVDMTVQMVCIRFYIKAVDL